MYGRGRGTAWLILIVGCVILTNATPTFWLVVATALAGWCIIGIAKRMQKPKPIAGPPPLPPLPSFSSRPPPDFPPWEQLGGGGPPPDNPAKWSDRR